MSWSIRYSAVVAFLVLCASPLVAQSATKIPIRPLGAIVATSKDTLSSRVGVRELSNGSVLVNDAFRARVWLYDANLSNAKLVIDSASEGGNQPGVLAPLSLIRYAGDSTLYVDARTQSMVVLDANAKVARVMALPRPTDLRYLDGGANGSPAFDSEGRLVYRGVIVPPQKPFTPPLPGQRMTFPMPEQPDSSPIVRADFDTRKIDTLAKLKVRKTISSVPEYDAQGKLSIKTVMDPTASGDEWAMLSDGSIAIVRAHDYHIDWVDADGAQRSTPKMPMDWLRLTDEKKQLKIDSIRAGREAMQASMTARGIKTADGKPLTMPSYNFPPLDKMSDYEPPITPGSVKADLSGNLWILPRTSIAAQNGLLYDVINRQGEITHRVQFPKFYYLMGFGAGGVVYVLRNEAGVTFLARAKLP